LLFFPCGGGGGGNKNLKSVRLYLLQPSLHDQPARRNISYPVRQNVLEAVFAGRPASAGLIAFARALACSSRHYLSLSSAVLREQPSEREAPACGCVVAADGDLVAAASYSSTVMVVV
jgi:hypothetical protein